MGRRWIGAAILLAALTALGLQTGVVTRTGFLMGDFRAFYCAARTASIGANPYLVEPLRSCETSIGSTPFFKKNPGVAIPAPLPGYSIAALVPLALLPFPIAAALWGALLALACIACVLALARCASVAWETTLAIFALALAALSLPFGEVVPIALGSICLSGYFAWRGRPRAAALAAAVAMIEPHLGLPVCVALALWLPASRVVLACAFGALGMLSLVALGPAVNLEYFTSVLPAHALSEATRDTQYSLTAVLAALGLSPSLAVRGGTLWYVAMLSAGAFVAGRLAQRTRNPAFLACVPPAFAVFGGTFIHVTQIAAALPAAALLVAYSSRTVRVPAIVALLALAVPWDWVVSPALIIAPLVPVAYLAWRYTSQTKFALVAGLCAAAILLGLIELVVAAPHAAAHTIAPAIDPRLAEASWSRFTQKGSTNVLAGWMLRLPTWAGLALLLGLLVREAGGLRLSARAPAIAFGALCALLPIAGQFYGDRHAGWLGVDARAYYCAALAQREGRNPYYDAPLHQCESAGAAPFYRAPKSVTVPAPYPPYALALFYPFTLVPFQTAMLAWWIVLTLALLVAAYALARIAGEPALVGWAALALAAGLTSFSAGNVLPLALAAIVLAAFCASRARPIGAAAAIALAMVEPHLALPAAIALFAGYAAVRIPMLVAFAALGALAVAAGGLAETIAYVTQVLPAHALSEVSRDNQYSLSTVVAALGLSDMSAVLFGNVWYAIMTALGVVTAITLAHRYGEPALIVLVPPAFALLGGTFVHTGEIAAAVPACLVLYSRAREYRGWIFAALLLLAIPWMMASSAAIFLAPVFPAAYLTYALWSRDRAAVLGTAVASFAVLVALFVLAAVPPAHAGALPHAYAAIDPRLAEASWRQFVLGNSTNRPVMWLLRLPTWIGLLAFVWAAAANASKRGLVTAELPAA
ncbi:MAG: glycosyltransferase 87 family protein [Candidatus Cybelea sp.]